MQGRQLARGSALSSCFAKKKSRVRGPTRPPLDRASRCAARQLRVLKHPRQIRAPRTAWIIHVVRNLLRALGCQFIEPINELGIAATLLNETVQAITTIAPALLTGHAQHIELADEIAEYDCAVAGHGAMIA